MLIHFGREVCGDLAEAELREWWLSSGTGAYASGTVAGSLSRRYHGLLIAPQQGTLNRQLILAKADATLYLHGKAWPLFTNRWYGDVVEPAGHLYLQSFHLEGRMPVWRYAIDELLLEMRVWMEPGETTSYVAYVLHGAAQKAVLSVDLLINRRDHHAEMPVEGMTAEITQKNEALHITWPEGEPMIIHTTPMNFEQDRQWCQGFLLAEERARGLQEIDNHLSIGRLQYDLQPGQWVGFAATTNTTHQFDPERSMQGFLKYDEMLLENAKSTYPGYVDAPAWIRQLVLAADSFLIQRRMPSGRAGDSVIAGYPWFGDWGRDTMIALPGLTLATGRHASALAILRSYAALVDRGQLPNRLFSADEEPEYNTVDAALWFIQAWYAYLESTGDETSFAAVFPVLHEIIDWYVKGTRFGIRMDPEDHLLTAGEPGQQLTWMDAKIGDWVVTPRIGKAVEINALWYNALRILASFDAGLGEQASTYQQMAVNVKKSFQRFVRDDGQGLYDVLDGPEGTESRVRPNQILAVSLPHSALTSETQKQVVAVCARDLLCAYGLRSLSPHDNNYSAVYTGDMKERDSAYHQGTVWGWLLGHYALAEYRVTGDATAALDRLAPLAAHLQQAGLGSISEIFDGDPPHHPKGAPAQAWSVACTLEAWLRVHSRT